MNQPNYNPDVLTCLANLSNDEVFTPPVVVNQMLDLLPVELWSNPDARFLDPVSKSGIFLREMAKRLDKGLENIIPDKQKRINHIFTKQLFGIAITELTGLLSRRSAYCSKTANGKYSICEEFDNEQGNVLFHRIEHTWQGGKCRYCGASETVYSRGEELETHAYEFIHTDKPEKIFNNMKFDVIIGNPPYQLNDGGAGASAKPLYHLFIQQAKKLNPRFLTMITPSRWFAGGKGLDEFREEMLSDKRLVNIVDYVNAKDCFAGISIGGGVSYFLWDRDNPRECDYTNIHDGKTSSTKRILNEFTVFVRYNEAISIIHKVFAKDNSNICSCIGSRNPFGFASSIRGKQDAFSNSVKLYSSQDSGYVEKSQITQGVNNIGKYKIMISKVTSEHAGEPDKNGMFKVLSRTQILKPNEVCTDSYLTAYNTDNKDEAINFHGYLLTKFCRFLLLQAISSINLSKDKFYFIPLQDFSESWTDEKLYKKYGLTADEIAFIDSMIRPMEISNE